MQHVKIGISGAAEDICTPDAFDKAEKIGYYLAKKGVVVVTGDTSGIPFAAAKGAKRAGGFTVGVSPASSYREHVKKYKLPYKYIDFAIYTGFGYSGRNLLFIRSTDAVIFICGRIGTLNEFTIAFEDKKPIGILTETGGVSNEIDHLLNVSKRGRAKIAFDNNPEKLAEKIIQMARQDINATNGD
ncbi:hypothetical protein A3A71_04175 [Candidatus Berkelbacteria bacterium RIFCSPLOWO2_01_FULL_50_28]|uniref:TIGR00725 family protein n=1 Tax=Candidatus Berkelbacteria bacterium RIFCSPLOWO2_01_FULL_50_28 TaxID=1797471 RepID=A0A1F5EA89_9BACT|nr:MAG: hypothetical protein A2807_03435 [Candidatus Berkelbacteria bacterium RIFCSPHIGHO2_01_FULL_50_36]OGD62452.1 MAG: hypothetical protein A3F39_01975 [Candidatus Berkelbacteria bacterium RIFCSPHIGHO2_12_FULL_50_11]OGD64329.1 MAG: hypothetical protein A3A71_04175 [Candidatus Berkelbacteria bacterium RIFCSPLOWO2_01_FULL_50_28]